MFNIGDTVRCINDRGTSHLTYGYHYIVSGILTQSKELTLYGLTSSWFWSRFEPVIVDWLAINKEFS